MAIDGPYDLVAYIAEGNKYACSLSWTNPITYERIEILFNRGSGWSYITSTWPGDRDWYDYIDLQPNETTYFLVRGVIPPDRSPDSNIDSCFAGEDTSSQTVTLSHEYSDSHQVGVSEYEDISQQTVTLSHAYSDGGSFSDTSTQTVTLSHTYADTILTGSDFAYYLGDSVGKIYHYDDAYLSDNGTEIVCLWRSKILDFADMYPELANKWKCIHRIRLLYKDLTTTTNVIIGVSNDSGATWTTKSKELGTGTDRKDEDDFWFMISGVDFQFYIEHGSTDKELQFLGIEVEFEVAGDYWKTS